MTDVGQQGQGQFAVANPPKVQKDNSGLSSSKAINSSGRWGFLAGGLLSRPMARQVNPCLRACILSTSPIFVCVLPL